MDHLVAVEVIGELPIVSVVGYREIEEPLFADGMPVFDDEGNPAVRIVKRPNTEDVLKGGTAYLDPAETQIHLLVQCGLVRMLPAAKAKK